MEGHLSPSREEHYLQSATASSPRPIFRSQSTLINPVSLNEKIKMMMSLVEMARRNVKQDPRYAHSLIKQCKTMLKEVETVPPALQWRLLFAEGRLLMCNGSVYPAIQQYVQAKKIVSRIGNPADVNLINITLAQAFYAHLEQNGTVKQYELAQALDSVSSFLTAEGQPEDKSDAMRWMQAMQIKRKLLKFAGEEAAEMATIKLALNSNRHNKHWNLLSKTEEETLNMRLLHLYRGKQRQDASMSSTAATPNRLLQRQGLAQQAHAQKMHTQPQAIRSNQSSPDRVLASLSLSPSLLTTDGPTTRQRAHSSSCVEDRHSAANISYFPDQSIPRHELILKQQTMPSSFLQASNGDSPRSFTSASDCSDTDSSSDEDTKQPSQFTNPSFAFISSSSTTSSRSPSPSSINMVSSMPASKRNVMTRSTFPSTPTSPRRLAQCISSNNSSTQSLPVTPTFLNSHQQQHLVASHPSSPKPTLLSSSLLNYASSPSSPSLHLKHDYVQYSLEELHQLKLSQQEETARIDQAILHHEIQRAYREGKEHSSNCSVCMEHKVEICIMPCRHACVCSSCFEDLAECPICRTSIEDKMTIFVP